MNDEKTNPPGTDPASPPKYVDEIWLGDAPEREALVERFVRLGRSGPPLEIQAVGPDRGARTSCSETSERGISNDRNQTPNDLLMPSAEELRTGKGADMRIFGPKRGVASGLTEILNPGTTRIPFGTQQPFPRLPDPLATIDEPSWRENNGQRDGSIEP